MKPALWPLLGGVRFLLALIVAAAHSTMFANGNALTYRLTSMSGFAAVLGFLVISGFSIAASYAQQPAGFYRRRARRIVPLYVLAIVAGWAVMVWFGGSVVAPRARYVTPGISDVLQNLVFLQGFTAHSIRSNPVVWSLSIEVACYIAARFLAHRSTREVVLITMGSLAVFLMLPFTDAPYFSTMMGGLGLASLAWAWLAGFLIHRFQNRLNASMIVFGVILVALVLNPAAIKAWPLTLLIVCAAIGFGAKLNAPQWVREGLELLGDASYPLYLFHIPVFIILCALKADLSAMCYILVAILVAIGLDRGFDQPLKRLVLRKRETKQIPLAPKPVQAIV